MEFKVGDKVRVHLIRQSIPQKQKYDGKVVTINRVLNCSHEWKYIIEGCDYGWCEDEFELVTNEKIVITHDGKTTTATLYRDGEKVTTTAKCAPDDNFGFIVGAKLAMERLVDKATKPEYYNGKVVCVKSDRDFTVGKVYEIVDGIIRDNFGVKRPEPSNPNRFIESMNDPWLNGCIYHFIPLVE